MKHIPQPKSTEVTEEVTKDVTKSTTEHGIVLPAEMNQAFKTELEKLCKYLTDQYWPIIGGGGPRKALAQKLRQACDSHIQAQASLGPAIQELKNMVTADIDVNSGARLLPGLSNARVMPTGNSSFKDTLFAAFDDALARAAEAEKTLTHASSSDSLSHYLTRTVAAGTTAAQKDPRPYLTAAMSSKEHAIQQQERRKEQNARHDSKKKPQDKSTPPRPPTPGRPRGR